MNHFILADASTSCKRFLRSKPILLLTFFSLGLIVLGTMTTVGPERDETPDNGDMTMRFVDYLSVLSAVQHLKPDGILVHGDAEPQGSYWKDLVSRNLARYLFRNKTTAAGQRRGTPKEVAFKEHAADISKLDVLLEYGGVVADFDVFFVRGERIKQILAKKRAITCYGDVDGNNIGLVARTRTRNSCGRGDRATATFTSPTGTSKQCMVSKYLSILYREEVYVLDKVCNNPAPDQRLDDYFRGHGKIHWRTRWPYIPTNDTSSRDCLAQGFGGQFDDS
ncbi:hypothetical protein BV898_11308 [Hypsibius exemplaris]|uniref:Uncharacterized protein n=1 Tax=Hypsibius exemplaris TaxID=2072580 RepID=A0A1W0WGY6_HYPEX|nr:hypothetical protein BV898_11308 [Hypsibius exemplaris]